MTLQMINKLQNEFEKRILVLQTFLKTNKRFRTLRTNEMVRTKNNCVVALFDSMTLHDVH